MQYVKIQNNTIHYNKKQYKTIQYNTIHYNTKQYNTIQYITIQNNTKQYNKIDVSINIHSESCHDQSGVSLHNSKNNFLVVFGGGMKQTAC